PSLNCDRKCAPSSLVALDINRSAVERDQFPHESKADSRAFMGARFCALYSMETFEQTRQLGCGDADSGVGHRELNVVIAPAKCDRDLALESMFEGIGEQVEHDLLPHLPVYIDWLGQGRAVHD